LQQPLRRGAGNDEIDQFQLDGTCGIHQLQAYCDSLN
jgi:hypothetical protein